MQGNTDVDNRSEQRRKRLPQTQETLRSRKWGLVATAGVAAAWGPVDDDEAEAHYHKQEANPSKAGSLEEREKERPDWHDCRSLSSHQQPSKLFSHHFYLPLCFSLSIHSYAQVAYQDFGHGKWRFIFFGHNTNVEDSWEDEYETRGRCGACKKIGFSILYTDHMTI